MIDTRRYQRMIGGIGLLLVIAFSVYLYAGGNRSAHPGIGPGRPLEHFVAPLATSDLNAPANVSPRCDPARPATRGLNVCGRQPIVLAFFAPGARPCVRAVAALQAIAPRFPQFSFAAVAAGGGKRATLKLIRQHHWTLPVAYDSTAAVAQLYRIDVCPLIEVARRGGIVARLLIGERWGHEPALRAALTQVLSEKR